MARKQKTLRYMFEGYFIRTPNVVETGTSRHSWMNDMLNFLKEIAEGHGSSKLTWEGNYYWEAQLGEHEKYVMTRWLSWHQQYEMVATFPELFVIPVETEAVKT